MVHDNPYLAPATDLKVERPARPLPKSLMQAVWWGAKGGVKWTTYVIGPIAVLMLFFCVGFMAFAVVSPASWKNLTDQPLLYLKILRYPFLFYLVFCFYGVIFGVVIQSIAYTLRGIRDYSRVLQRRQRAR